MFRSSSRVVQLSSIFPAWKNRRLPSRMCERLRTNLQQYYIQVALLGYLKESCSSTPVYETVLRDMPKALILVLELACYSKLRLASTTPSGKFSFHWSPERRLSLRPNPPE